MRKMSKIISFVLLPLITLILFIIIGKIQTYREYTVAPMHHAMSSDMYMNIWIGRGIYSMLLVMAISLVILSRRTNAIKAITFSLLILLNAPAIYFIYVLIPCPLFILVVPIINLIAFIPFYIKEKPIIS